MGKVMVEQIGRDGGLVLDVDTRLAPRVRDELILSALPGARVEDYAGSTVIRFRDQVILRKQVTYLGIPWDVYKKRIQIPPEWKDIHRQAVADGLTCRFVGVYHYGGVTIFVDFDPSTYVLRKANNSAAHVSTNDLFQAQTLGVFERYDKNDNFLASVRADLFAAYLLGEAHEEHPYLDVLKAFNAELLTGERIEALTAVREMHAAAWPDVMHGEWAGFYLEYRLAAFLDRSVAGSLVSFQKVKQQGAFDYDLAFWDGRRITHYGDLKASDATKRESPGNDAADLSRCLDEYGRFWYVIYEHDTWHSRDEGDLPVIAWNEWRRSVGHVGRKAYDPLSYARRFKSAVRFVRMSVLEVNEANRHQVLVPFNQGRQPDGSKRAPKVLITKKNIDNFLIYSESAEPRRA